VRPKGDRELFLTVSRTMRVGKDRGNTTNGRGARSKKCESKRKLYGQVLQYTYARAHRCETEGRPNISRHVSPYPVTNFSGRLRLIFTVLSTPRRQDESWRSSRRRSFQQKEYPDHGCEVYARTLSDDPSQRMKNRRTARRKCADRRCARE